MSINAYKIKKWFSMILGTSVLYVNQGIGKAFKKGELHGYFNDLTEKVTRDKETLERKKLPGMKDEKGNEIVFATTIFQYGLGCYDLILTDYQECYEDQFRKCVEWAFNNQNEDGGWDISSYAGKDAPYGAMAQGEGISLLLRAYMHYGDERFFESAEKALELLLSPIEKKGTAKDDGSGLYLMEFTNKPCVLNGWIFAIFGIYDYLQVCNTIQYQEVLDRAISTLIKNIESFDCGYWSMYDLGGAIASPFYHRLHISQLEALEIITDNPVFHNMRLRFVSYQNKLFYRFHAFIKKVFQKVFSNNE